MGLSYKVWVSSVETSATSPAATALLPRLSGMPCWDSFPWKHVPHKSHAVTWCLPLLLWSQNHREDATRVIIPSQVSTGSAEEHAVEYGSLLTPLATRGSSAFKYHWPRKTQKKRPPWDPRDLGVGRGGAWHKSSISFSLLSQHGLLNFGSLLLMQEIEGSNETWSCKHIFMGGPSYTHMISTWLQWLSVHELAFASVDLLAGLDP